MLKCTPFSFQMHFILFFSNDKEILLVEEDFIILGEFESYRENEWRNMPIDRHCPVQAYYDGELFEAAIIQALQGEDEGVMEQVKMMRLLVEKKNFREEHLLQRLKSRFRSGRSRFPPLEVIRSVLYTNL